MKYWRTILQISIANYRSLETGSRADLVTVLELFQQSPLFFGAEFPSRPQDVSIVCQKFVSHATGNKPYDKWQGEQEIMI